jgi:O-antigen biosynthesis protein WbqP
MSILFIIGAGGFGKEVANVASFIFYRKTGIIILAQVNKIVMFNPKLSAKTYTQMVQYLNVWYYFKYIFLTVFGKGFGDGVKR